MGGIIKDKTASVSSLELDLSLIDEDPDQPRTEFDPVTLQELADTIRLRGVKTPISVHPNPKAKGRFIINHGARRFRASKLVKKKRIPAFIDTDYSQVDQVIENLQRDALTPREIADFIGYQLSKGLIAKEIARKIGKSDTFVSQHLTLLNLPITIAALFDTGKVRDVWLINSLVKAFKECPEVVIDWVKDPEQEISRYSVNMLRQFIKIDKRQIKEAKSDPGVKTASSNKKINQISYSNDDLSSLLDQLQGKIDSQKDVSFMALDSLTKGERDNLSAILHKLVNFEKT